MATKTLTITEEAYDALKAKKLNEESFSKTVLRITKKRGLPMKYFGMWKNDKRLKKRIIDERKRFDKDMEARQQQFSRQRA